MTAGSVSVPPGKATDRAKLPEDHPRTGSRARTIARGGRRCSTKAGAARVLRRSRFPATSTPWPCVRGARASSPRSGPTPRTIEDPDERFRRIATEIVDARGLDLVLRALRAGSIELRAVLADLVFGRKAPVEPPSNRQFSDWWNQEKP
jgi:hypothetical protein